MKKFGYSKGVLLTLLTIIVFVVMLGSVIAYVVVNISYDNLQAAQASALTQSFSVSTLTQNTKGFLHTSLQQAIYALTSYNSNSSLRTLYEMNNTPGFLESMMLNGSYYGVRMPWIMKGATISGYINSTTKQLAAQQISISFSNTSLRVYQSGPFLVTANYSALVTAATPQGSFSYPMSVVSSVVINGTASPYPLLQGLRSTINTGIIPQAFVVGQGRADTGSTSPFMSIAGTVIVAGSSGAKPTCAAIGSNTYMNQYYILAVYNAVNIQTNACGFGGLITTSANSNLPVVPYLVFSSNSYIFNSLSNGTQVLLDGPQLELLNLSALQSAVISGTYYGSNYTPAYLDRAQNTYHSRSPYGIFTLASAAYSVPHFNGGNANIVVSNTLSLTGNFALSFWFQSDKGYATSFDAPLISTLQPSTNSFDVRLCGGGSCGFNGIRASIGTGTNSITTNANAPFNFQAGVWYNVGLEFTTNGYFIEINGGPPVSGTYPTNTPMFANSVHVMNIGSGTVSGSMSWFSGKIADVQLYDYAVPLYKLQKAYTRGLFGYPVDTLHLVGDWPLTGNPNDYSGNNYNGVQNNVVYYYAANYTGDPVLSGMQYPNYNVSEVMGVMNCLNINQCMNYTAPHLYLSNASLEALPSGLIENERQAFGVQNAVISSLAFFQPGTNSYITNKYSLTWPNNGIQSYSVSLWIYPLSNNGVILSSFNKSTPWSKSRLELYDGGLYWTPASTCKFEGNVPVDAWTNIVYTANLVSGSTSSVMINGAVGQNTISSLSSSVPGTPGNSLLYQLGGTATTNCGSNTYYSGYTSDFQVFNQPLTNAQMTQLYLNNSVTGVPANFIWPLSSQYLGALNTTSVIGTNDYGVFYTNGILCTQINSVEGTCGASIAPP